MWGKIKTYFTTKTRRSQPFDLSQRYGGAETENKRLPRNVGTTCDKLDITYPNGIANFQISCGTGADSNDTSSSFVSTDKIILLLVRVVDQYEGIKIASKKS